MKLLRGKTEYWFRIDFDSFYWFTIIPWIRNDVYRGFIHFLCFHLNWYPRQSVREGGIK